MMPRHGTFWSGFWPDDSEESVNKMSHIWREEGEEREKKKGGRGEKVGLLVKAESRSSEVLTNMDHEGQD